MTSLATRMTADEFLSTEHGGWELVDGEPLANPMSALTSFIGGELFRRMANFAIERQLGQVFPQETGIRVWNDDPRRVRKPDAMFVASARAAVPDEGWLTVVPDLVAEIVSPRDIAEGIQRKVADYRAAGVPLIWVIYPETRIAYVYRRGNPVRELAAEDSLDGEDVLPGFALSLAELLDSARVDG